MRAMVITAAILLLSAHRLPAAEPLTLREALTTALANHPRTMAARQSLAGADARAGQARSGYYPRLDLVADWNRGRSYLTALEGFKETETYTAGLTLRQTIHDFGRTSGTVAAAEGERGAARESLAAVRQDVALRVREIYTLLLTAERRTEALRETVRAREEVLGQARAFYREGVRPRLDVVRAEADLYAARTLLTAAENERDMARVDLAAAMGLDSLPDRPLAEPDGEIPSLPDLAEAKRRATAGRVELKRYDALHAAAQGAATAARGGHLPVIEATAGAGYADRSFPPEGNTWGVGVRLTVPIFAGFATREKEREAAAALREVEAGRRDQQLQVGREVEGAWLGMREALARVESTGRELEAARESRTLAIERYREGVGTIIEVTDAQARELEAETANIRARGDTRIALARLDRAVGDDGGTEQ
ncbi:TolC family protein [Geobacter sulfurreducens]|uniref:TolC family protein n=1 Tax=Geobacter sulfurreducens TaxID=35554 RepID=UPI000DBB1257|nr:TolC family protein [Geobacter sulfurreducens]BBA69494.1 Outer membrane efflux protein BepC [Geobacter sulfurreducens]